MIFVATLLRLNIPLFVGLSILVLGFSAGPNEATLCIEGPPGSPFYVSPIGKDSWSGLLSEPNADGTDGPFATLARARDAMRADPDIDITFVREGTYQLSGTLQLTSQDSGVSFVAYAGEAPIISGGQAGLGTIIKLDNADGVSILGLTFSDAIKDTHLDGFALELRNVDGATIGYNTFLNVGTAIEMNGSSNNSIFGNEMGHIAFVGVEMAGGSGNLILGNYMHDLGEIFKHAAAGVLLHSGADSNRIAYNLIENSSTYGISIKSSGTEQVVEYNKIINVGTEAHDAAAIEMLNRSGDDTGTIIRYNYIEGAGQYSQSSFISGVYLDDLTSGVTIHGNFIKDVSLSGFHLHGGRNIEITNNIVILGNEPVLTSSGSIWNSQIFVWEQVDGARPRLMENIEWSTNIISAPEGLTPDADYWKTGGDLAGAPIVSNNLLHNVNGYDDPAAGTPEDGSIFADPLFADPANGDYTLQTSSPAFDLGFEPLPFAQMGLAGFEVLDLALLSEVLANFLGYNPVFGTEAGDSLTGTDDPDLLDGAGGNDVISGGIGADVLFGGAGNDTLDGGSGNDTIYGGPGADTINVSLGRDLVVYENLLDGDDIINGFDAEGNDSDMINLDVLFDGLFVATADRAGRILVEAADNEHTVRVDTSGDGSFDFVVATVNVMEGGILNVGLDSEDVQYGSL